MKKSDYLVLLKRLGFSFLFYPLTRIIFYIFNLDYFSGIDFSQVVLAFLYGFRFDLSTVLIANSFFIIGSLIPLRHQLYNKLLKFIFVIMNVLFIGVNIVDIKFFPFIGKKMTFDIFDMGSDISDQTLQIILNYWPFSLMILASFVVLWTKYPVEKNDILYKAKVPLYKALSIGLIGLVITFIGIRGGVQLRSISPKQAFVFEKYELGNLALNASYSMIRSIGKKGIPKKNYFKSDIEALSLIKNSRNFSSNGPKLEKQNVVVIILESFSQEYIDEGYAPFFSQLAEKSLYLQKNYANGRRSLEALPSILTGIPSVIGKPIYQSQYQSNAFYSLPYVLKEAGYSTSFFHGGKKGTMDFDAYCSSIGIDKYYAKENYPDQTHYDGTWGIYDHYFFRYMLKELGQKKEPFFSSFFSLSSHQPYSIPSDLENMFEKGKLEIHQSIAYADYALKDFFEKAKSESWYKNTLFVVTADHTQKLANPKNQNTLGRYRVPLLFFHPSLDLKIYKKEKVTQHVDIMPTILDILNINFDKKLYFGSSVFSEDSGRMLNFSSGFFTYYKKPYLIRFSDENSSYYKYENDQLLGVELSEVPAGLIEELKAYIQYTNNGLRNNNIYKISR